jgi:hypothetical protein
VTKPCSFSKVRLQFNGTPAEQAACLLRRVRVGGNVDNTSSPIPQLLLDRVGVPIDFSRSQLEAYLTRKAISAREIGGSLDKSVSRTSRGTPALYFVIHDTSDALRNRTFPPTINKASWGGNNLEKRPTSSAHVFINRAGQSKTGHNYSQAWRATKREKDIALKGLFLHHELVQPRIKGTFKYAAVAPTPGFTAKQIERLALCYIAASLRRKSWLIPAFHCVLDLGISDAHDDPQHFDIFQWAGAIEKILANIKTQTELVEVAA